ncbi:ABC1-domain-containing protein [Clavulina sp. PMI_390]|nr:ABC1-domain-containing protein [Clavulina sp. PMI_390]
MIAIDYKLNFDPDSLESINALHERASDRLLKVCERNRGLYVKLAQALATQGPFLPPAYGKLGKLLDDAEHFPYEVVQETIKREFGAPIEELFVRFDPVPIAAASIAQVHRARIRLPSGEEEEVAVKVQRPDIRRHAKWDLWAYRTMLQLYGYFFELPLDFAADYISDQLMAETRFDHEAANSEHIKHLVANSPVALIRNTVYVPRIHPQLCTQRVLTMEYIPEANKLTDLKAIETKGLSVKKVGRSVAEVFASMIFDMGFVQADGHPSNVLIRKHPNGKQGQHQVVLIDHGLYIPLSSDFRRKYCELWFAIFIADIPTIKRICGGWGIGQAELFASATLLKPWRMTASSPSSSPTAAPHDPLQPKPLTKEEIEKLSPAELHALMEERQLAAAREIKERIKTFLTDVELVPKELIFIGRAMRILQANNQALGSPVNRLNIMARHASSGLVSDPPPFVPDLAAVTSSAVGSEEELQMQVVPTATVIGDGALDASVAPTYPVPASTRLSDAERLQTYLTFLRFRTALFAIDAAFYLTNFVAWWIGVQRGVASLVYRNSGDASDADGKGKKIGKFEDVLEEKMRDMAKSNFGVVIPDEEFDA